MSGSCKYSYARQKDTMLFLSLSVPIFTANELIQLRKPHTDRLELGRGECRGEASVIPAAFDLRFDSFQLVKVSLGHDEMLPTR